MQRVAATVTATLLLWFVWWLVGGLLLIWIGYSIGGIAIDLMGILWWTGIITIPPLVWFRFRHV